KMRPEVKYNASQFLRVFHHETRSDIFPVLANKRFNFFFQSAGVFSVEGNVVLAFRSPASGPIEGLGGDVSGKEGDGIQSSLSRRTYDLAQIGIICPLHCGAAADHKVRP